MSTPYLEILRGEESGRDPREMTAAELNELGHEKMPMLRQSGLSALIAAAASKARSGAASLPGIAAFGRTAWAAILSASTRLTLRQAPPWLHGANGKRLKPAHKFREIEMAPADGQSEILPEAPRAKCERSGARQRHYGVISPSEPCIPGLSACFRGKLGIFSRAR